MSQVEQGPVPGIAYTPEEAAAFLRASPGGLRKGAQKGRYPHTRVGREIRFSADHIAAIIAAGHRPAKREAPPAPVARPRRQRRPAPQTNVTILRPRPGARKTRKPA